MGRLLSRALHKSHTLYRARISVEILLVQGIKHATAVVKAGENYRMIGCNTKDACTHRCPTYTSTGVSCAVPINYFCCTSAAVAVRAAEHTLCDAATTINIKISEVLGKHQNTALRGERSAGQHLPATRLLALDSSTKRRG